MMTTKNRPADKFSLQIFSLADMPRDAQVLVRELLQMEIDRLKELKCIQIGFDSVTSHKQACRLKEIKRTGAIVHPKDKDAVRQLLIKEAGALNKEKVGILLHQPRTNSRQELIGELNQRSSLCSQILDRL